MIDVKSNGQIDEVRFKSVSVVKETGANYTPAELSRFVAMNIVENLGPLLEKETLRVLDPAVGDGELLVALVKELSASFVGRIELLGFDVDESALAVASQRLNTGSSRISLQLFHSDFLETGLSTGDCDLFENCVEDPIDGGYDIVISNPPYVRTQVLGSHNSIRISEKFGLGGKVDIYQAFILSIISRLSKDGVVGLIVSNRLLSTKTGAAIRSAMLKNLNISHVWDLGDTRLFDAAVLPCVIMAGGSNRTDLDRKKISSIYQMQGEVAETHFAASSVYEALRLSGNVLMNDGKTFVVQHGVLNTNGVATDGWSVRNVATETFLKTVEHFTWKKFGDVGKIRVGVKTCADKVFIVRHESVLSSELLRPLITHHVARRFRCSINNMRSILYTHEFIDGVRKPVDIEKYPSALSYLEANRAILERRKYLIEAGRQWYELWVPHHPLEWSKPKVVFRDISIKPTFWIDLEGYVVNGDCYWMTLGEGVPSDVLWLIVAVANSEFIEKYYDTMFNNKLYAGRRRFITQYVELFPLPDPNTQLSREIVRMAKEVFGKISFESVAALEKTLNRLVWQAFGLLVE